MFLPSCKESDTTKIYNTNIGKDSASNLCTVILTFFCSVDSPKSQKTNNTLVISEYHAMHIFLLIKETNTWFRFPKLFTENLGANLLKYHFINTSTGSGRFKSTCDKVAKNTPLCISMHFNPFVHGVSVLLKLSLHSAAICFRMVERFIHTFVHDWFEAE